MKSIWPLPQYKGETLLTTPLTDEEQAKAAAELARIERLRDIAEVIWLGCYADGYLKFEEMCSRAARTLAPLDEGLRHRILGRLVDQALRTTPASVKARNKGEAPLLQEASLLLLGQIKKHERLPSTVGVKGTPITLFERGSHILHELGAEVSASQLERWYYGKNKRRG